MSAHRSGSGSVTVTKMSSSWTQKVPEPHTAGSCKSLCPLLFINTQQSISATTEDRDSPDQASLHYILVMKKDGEGTGVGHMTQCLDWKWHLLDYTSDREARII